MHHQPRRAWSDHQVLQETHLRPRKKMRGGLYQHSVRSLHTDGGTGPGHEKIFTVSRKGPGHRRRAGRLCYDHQPSTHLRLRREDRPLPPRRSYLEDSDLRRDDYLLKQIEKVLGPELRTSILSERRLAEPQRLIQVINLSVRN